MTHHLGDHTRVGLLNAQKISLLGVDLGDDLATIKNDLTTKLSSVDLSGKQDNLTVANSSSSTFDGVTFANGGLDLTDSTITYIPPASIVDWTVDQTDTDINKKLEIPNFSPV